MFGPKIRLNRSTGNDLVDKHEIYKWLLLAFCPKIWEVAGTYELLFCLKKNAASVVLTMLSGGDTQTLLDGKKKLFF